MESCSKQTLRLKRVAESGFTVVELVSVIVVLSILSYTGLSRFFSVSIYNQNVYSNELRTTLRYAKQIAIATNSYVQVAVSPSSPYNTITLKYASFSSTCGTTPITLTNIVDPLTNSNASAYTRVAPTNVTFTVTGTFPIYFNSLGQAITVSGTTCSTTTNPTVTVLGQSAITIYGATGFLQ